MNKKLSLTAGVALLLLTVLFAAVYAAASGVFVSAESQPPCDIGKSYARDAILTVCDKGLVNTYTAMDGSEYYYPAEAVTRAELAYSLSALMGLDTKKYTRPLGFADEDTVPTALLPSVRAAVANGLIALQSDFALYPSEKVTREEAAFCFGALCKAEIAAGKTDAFADLSEVRPYFESNLRKVAEFEIMVGYDDGTFRPKGELLREELAVILCRLLENENFRKGKSLSVERDN